MGSMAPSGSRGVSAVGLPLGGGRAFRGDSLAAASDDNAIVDHQMAELDHAATDHATAERPARRRRVVAAGNDVIAPGRHYATLSAELRAAYEALNDWERSRPIISPRKRCCPGMFDSYRLRALQRFALTCGEGAGLTGAEQERLYDLLDIWDGTKPGMPVDAGHNLNLRDVFKSPNAFKNALRDDVDAALLAAGWRKVTLEQNGDTFHAFFRSVLDVIMALIRDSGDVQYWSGGDGPAPLTARRETPMDGDAFRMCEQEVHREHGPHSLVLGLHVYSDAKQISKSGAFKLYPLRVRVVNVITDEVRFVTVAYIPVVRKRTEAGAEEKARRRRSAVLQRVLYLAFRTAIGASHSGKEVLVGDRVLLAFPRILLYLADLPEEKAVLCINSGE
ncbi:hypothetical protein I4F81_009390 [Pyropia yezoensis]|uniref:Uncharacterized protein n=1 Tax=Pyropia yezoensis TaxID=2788 RepID=A0ACC3CAG9_PYRYE|nr:hypothetical protein I4F81_009390 [Neopyropia yezoensis]